MTPTLCGKAHVPTVPSACGSVSNVGSRMPHQASRLAGPVPGGKEKWQDLAVLFPVLRQALGTHGASPCISTFVSLRGGDITSAGRPAQVPDATSLLWGLASFSPQPLLGPAPPAVNPRTASSPFSPSAPSVPPSDSSCLAESHSQVIQSLCNSGCRGEGRYP